MAGTRYITIIIMLIAVVLVLAIPIIIGCYVYKDAKRRGMDAVLWTVVAVLVPGLIGLIIYLIVRGNNTDVICPVCEKESSNNYVLCPHCGNPLKACCKNCNTVIDPSWKLCPQCGTEIKEEDFAQVNIPKPKKDKGIRTLVIVLITLTLCALLFGIFGLTQYMVVGSRSGSYSLTQGLHMEVDSEEISPDVRAWVDDWDNIGEGVYILQLSPERIIESGKTSGKADDPENLSCFIYVYVNNYRGNNRIEGLDSYVYVDNKTMEIGFNSVSDSDDSFTEGYELTEICTTNDNIKKFNVLIDGDKVDFILTELK